MFNPYVVLEQARQGARPPTWRVFTKTRGRVKGFLRGTSADPDPLLVITQDGVAEYIDSKRAIVVVDFGLLARIGLRIKGSSFKDSTIVHLHVWLDLHYLNGQVSKWSSASFGGHGIIQAFIEAFGAHQALRAIGQNSR